MADSAPKTMHIDLPPEIHAAVIQVAKQEDRSARKQVVALLREALAQRQ